MINAKDGAKRIMSSQEVRGKGNDMMRSAKEFLGAVYNATHTKNSKAHKTLTPLKSRKASKKVKRKNN
jgi:hypothetical protein